MGRESVLLPARFLTMVAHFLATVQVQWAKRDNIQRALPMDYTQAQYDDLDEGVTGMFSLAMICFVVQALCFFFGFSMFSTGLNFLNITCHFCGGVLTSLFILSAWHYLWFTYICLFFSVIPAAAELINLGTVCCTRKKQW